MRRKKMAAQKRIVVVGALSLLLCFSIAYAAFNTTIQLSAKGNIKKVTAASKLRKLANAKSVDGLYADTYENGRFIFKGADPNNYITFNGEEWRIVSVEYDDTIKIVRNSVLDDSLPWNAARNLDWAQTSLNSFLNETYVQGLLEIGSIVEHNFAIGALTLNSDYEALTLQQQILGESSNYWNGKVGLLTASEYLRANTNTDECGSLYLNNTNFEKCRSTNYLSQIASSDYTVLWTMSPIINNTNLDDNLSDDENNTDLENSTLNESDKGLVLDNKYNYAFGLSIPFGVDNFKEQEIKVGTMVPADVETDYGVAPVVYLNADVELEGLGTKDEPYYIKK